MPCRDIAARTTTFARPGKPLLNGSGSYFLPKFGFSFWGGIGVIHPGHWNCGIPATLDADLAESRRKRLAPLRQFGYWEFTDVDGPAARPGGGRVNAL